MLQKLRMVRNQQTLWRLVLVVFAVALLGAYIYSRKSGFEHSGLSEVESKRSSLKNVEADSASSAFQSKFNTGEAKANAESEKKKCFRVTFTQEMLGKICAPNPNPAICRIATIAHLDRSEFKTARLRHPTGYITMMVHPSWDLISQAIISNNVWESEQTNFIRSALELLPGAGLLDVGSQLGAYSLHAAQMGRQVVAIDAFYQNSIRLFASATANGFQDRVRVYWNALALKSNGTMNMFLPSTCNVGGGAPQIKGSTTISDSIDVRTTLLDDIVIGDGCFSGVKDLVMKVDIEGSEWLIKEIGAGIFKRFKVSVVMMEWIVLSTSPKAPEIVQFFSSHSLFPYGLDGSRLRQLNSKESSKWPYDVFWATNEFVAEKLRHKV
uniref:Methyltransf_21 domain-containing protein n=1 Tax=Macrostomum lignano TaxID=282301 RepID=A0A1I8J5H0_9PLAT